MPEGQGRGAKCLSSILLLNLDRAKVDRNAFGAHDAAGTPQSNVHTLVSPLPDTKAHSKSAAQSKPSWHG